MTTERDFTAVGRDGLLALIAEQGQMIKALNENLTATQTRCTQLEEHRRQWRNRAFYAYGSIRTVLAAAAASAAVTYTHPAMLSLKALLLDVEEEGQTP